MQPRLQTLLLVLLLSAGLPVAAEHRVAPLTLEQLEQVQFQTTLEHAGEVPGGPSFNAYLVSYRAFGFKLHALVAVPRSGNGPWPVLVANHGFHPDPPRYGITADGVQHRPGDYYRMIPELYTAQGFLVVMPDYRGHNVSEGLEYAHGFLAATYYAQDVLALLPALDQIDGADASQVFLWGHSMGAEVSLRTLLLAPQVRAASLWSGMGGTLWEQAWHYGRQERQEGDNNESPKPRFDELRADIARLEVAYDPASTQPLEHLDRLKTPIIIHHGRSDPATRYDWSDRLALALHQAGKRWTFWSYDTADHLFRDKDLQLAVDRDVEFFKSLMD